MVAAAHKFYMGYIGAGSVIGLVEGVLYLTKSDAALWFSRISGVRKRRCSLVLVFATTTVSGNKKNAMSTDCLCFSTTDGSGFHVATTGKSLGDQSSVEIYDKLDRETRRVA